MYKILQSKVEFGFFEIAFKHVEKIKRSTLSPMSGNPKPSTICSLPMSVDVNTFMRMRYYPKSFSKNIPVSTPEPFAAVPDVIGAWRQWLNIMRFYRPFPHNHS
jgi:hypothetical protein